MNNQSQSDNLKIKDSLIKILDCYFLHKCEGLLEHMVKADSLLREIDKRGDFKENK
jgi:hypothetical protein